MRGFYNGFKCGLWLPYTHINTHSCVIDILSVGTNVAEGGPCPIAHYCPLNTSTPLPCEPGEYNNLTQQAVCYTCPEGYYCTGSIADFEYFPCPMVSLV